MIEDHWRIMGRYDPEHRTRFVIDEWGNWYKGGTELGPGYILSQAITLRDALHTAITFDVFNRHADKIAMANVAQTINCLHSLFARRGRQVHADARLLRVRDVPAAHGGAARAAADRGTRAVGRALVWLRPAPARSRAPRPSATRASA